MKKNTIPLLSIFTFLLTIAVIITVALYHRSFSPSKLKAYFATQPTLENYCQDGYYKVPNEQVCSRAPKCGGKSYEEVAALPQPDPASCIGASDGNRGGCKGWVPLCCYEVARTGDPLMCVGYWERLWCHPDQCKQIDQEKGKACNSGQPGICQCGHAFEYWCKGADSPEPPIPLERRLGLSTPTPSSIPVCVCKEDGTCDASCNFDKFNNTKYSTPIKCSLSSSNFPTPPSSTDTNNWCKRPNRTKGDTNGDSQINTLDYYYYVRASHQGNLPPNINSDFNGDGIISSSDRDIIIKALTTTNSSTGTPTPTTSGPTPTSAGSAPTLSPTVPANRQLSSSKLGIFIISTYPDRAKTIINRENKGTKVIKLIDPHLIDPLMQAVIDYKTKYPQGIVILRVYENTDKPENIFSIDSDPVLSANQFHDRVIKPALNILKSRNQSQYFDYIETPNENDNTPFGWGADQSTREPEWLGKFWERLVELNDSSGIKTCIASIPVGNPGGDADIMKNKMRAFLPALNKAKQKGGTFCYHAYTIEYSTDINIEQWYSLRYRLLHNIISEINPDLSILPFFLTEAAVDRDGNRETSGWKARGDANKYLNWLNWFDEETKKDSYVLGSTIFQIGDSGWSSFNIDDDNVINGLMTKMDK